jgi:small subunit ribosomal protein S7
MANKEIVIENFTQDATQEQKLASKFVNCVMKDGKKNAARKVVKTALSIAEDKIGEPALEVFKKAVDNIRPSVEVKSRRSAVLPIRFQRTLNRAARLHWLSGG